ncbi:ATP-binding protein [Streptomyces sp. NPDC097640]|uniref:ATP-binding protein n=1 Tax=Streptomyces sp. NPDC097640 TaxID=3157229 RepID=UPI0033235592
MSDVRAGRLKVYLGAAPGVGKTCRMLEEGRSRASRGADVVVGFVECHGRPRTEAMLDGLEVVPRAHRVHRGRDFAEMDLAAVLARRPQVAIVDEFAHSNVPGGRNAKRWQDVEELLAAGIDVITAVDIQQLASLNDVVERITRAPQGETLPDEVVRRARQIELVDMEPEGLRRRMAHGNIYAPEEIDAALADRFRPGNLTALRQLALLWVTDRVDEALRRYRAEDATGSVWETRERVVVGLTGGPEGDTLIRRAARIADRSAGGDLLAVHITRSAVERARLAEAAAEIEPIKAADRMRTALLRAVGHDLRTPLAAGWAAVTSLRGRDVEFSDEDREELLATADESLAKLSRLVENLLDLSRLQAGVLTLDLRGTTLEEVLPAVLADTPDVEVGELEEIPAVLADPPLLERVIANLVENAARHTPPGGKVVLTAGAHAGRVELRVVDRGPGLPRTGRDRIFEPFQRLGDTDNTTGLGLGLALSKGLTEAMDGTLVPEDTPGGGLTMVLSLPFAERAAYSR